MIHTTIIMAQIKRSDLEKAVSLQQANCILNTFYNDRTIYPYDDIHLKKGICKILIEEYCPLVNLANSLFLVRRVRLYQEGNAGPDGEIIFWYKPSYKIQITCSSEGYNRALMREQLSDDKIVFPAQKRKRDNTGKVISYGRVSTVLEDDRKNYFDRIISAIRKKELKYYKGTDTLIVLDEPAKFEHLESSNLHGLICNHVKENKIGLDYKRIYVCYGEQLRQIK